MKAARLGLLSFGIVLVSLVVALPNTELASLRYDHRWLGQAVNWLEALPSPVGLVHVLLFLVLGAAAKLAFSRACASRLLVALALGAALSELLQFWVPGRTPRFSDFGDDVIGVVVGVLFSSAALRLSRRPDRSSGAIKYDK